MQRIKVAVTVAATILAGLLACYVLAAVGVFHLRHPWTTEAERRVWIRSALTFRTVPYDTMRPRGKD